MLAWAFKGEAATVGESGRGESIIWVSRSVCGVSKVASMGAKELSKTSRVVLVADPYQSNERLTLCQLNARRLQPYTIAT